MYKLQKENNMEPPPPFQSYVHFMLFTTRSLHLCLIIYSHV